MDEQREREQRGLMIAATAKLQRADDGKRWFVPSQTRKGGDHYYTVKPDPAKPRCSCPDFEARQRTCKHIYAVEYVIQREFTFDEETQTETVTETVTVKQTYKQEWRVYNFLHAEAVPFRRIKRDSRESNLCCAERFAQCLGIVPTNRGKD